MTRQAQSLFREAFALALALVLALGLIAWAPTARAEESDSAGVKEVTGAELRWGVNSETGTKGHAPGTFNFLYAGDVSPHISGPNTAIPSSAWRSTSGDVTIQKRNEDGKLATASWADTQTDRSGAPLTAGAHSGLEMLFSGGEGTVDVESGTATISWDGTASIVYYSGFVYMTLSDPELKVTPSSAKITATLGGHKTDRKDAKLWEKITPRNVTIADLPRDCVELSGEKGFAVSPAYLGVEYSAPTGAAEQNRDGDSWGAFPTKFVDFANDTGSGSFWYSSGGTADPMKVALPVSVGWASRGSDNLTEACDSPTSGGTSKGILGQVIDDTVEDILRAAGTDVSDTAAAWMDEAWKPAQPDAVNAARAAQAGQGAQAGGGGVATSTDSTVSSDLVVDEEFSAQYDVRYSAQTPMTAGTVAATVASAPSTNRGTSGGGNAAPAAAPASTTDQGTVPVAANLPLSDVVYANTSASSDADNALPHWQWWVGGVLLALAAGLFLQTVLSKD